MLLVLGSALLLIAIIMVVTGFSAYSADRRTLIRRLTGSLMPPQQEEGAPHRLTLDDGLLKRFEKFVTPKSEAELSQIRRRLVRAGYRRLSAVRLFYAARA